MEGRRVGKELEREREGRGREEQEVGVVGSEEEEKEEGRDEYEMERPPDLDEAGRSTNGNGERGSKRRRRTEGDDFSR